MTGILTRYILINQSKFKGILRLQIIPISDSLRLQYSIHLFQKTGSEFVISNAIIESFKANSSNVELFNTLPLHQEFIDSFSFNECEQFVLYLQHFLSTLDSQNQISTYKIQLHKITIYLNYLQIFSMYNFLYQFVTNYELMRLQLQILMQQEKQIEIKPKSSPFIEKVTIQSEDKTTDDKEIIEDEIQNLDSLSIINDVLALSPNNIITYFISKYISSSIQNGVQEEKPLIYNDVEKKLTIQIQPLIDFELFGLSDLHYKSLIEILNSFEFTKDEYLSKLRFLIQQLNRLSEQQTKDNISLPLQIIEFLIFIYADKLHTNDLISQFTHSNPDIENYILNLVNYAANYILTNQFLDSKLKYNSIDFKHILSKKKTKLDNLDQIIVKERYLLDIDKESFTNLVFEKAKQESKTENTTKPLPLIINNPTVLNINNFINDKNKEIKSHLSYWLISSELKQLSNHKIITEEYHQLLQLSITPESSRSLIKVDTILSKYSSILLNNIFIDLSNIDTLTPISTINLLTNYIRPYLQSDSILQTEFYILYRLIIPFLYDIYNIDKIIDYFH